MIRYAQKNDLEQLRKLDQHLAPSELEQCIRDGRVLVLIRQELVGCLRYNLFWDNLPFMNLLFLAEDERGKGYGTQLIRFWEEEMRRQQHRTVMPSTRSDKPFTIRTGIYLTNIYNFQIQIIFQYDTIEVFECDDTSNPAHAISHRQKRSLL